MEKPKLTYLLNEYNKLPEEEFFKKCYPLIKKFAITLKQKHNLPQSTEIGHVAVKRGIRSQARSDKSTEK